MSMTETDRELLELAALAAGHSVVRWTDDGAALLLQGVEKPWNSLHENPHSDCMGDALWLAVKLSMKVSGYATKTSVTTENFYWEELHGANPYTATRRAITRAAAEIGHAMKDKQKELEP